MSSHASEFQGLRPCADPMASHREPIESLLRGQFPKRFFKFPWDARNQKTNPDSAKSEKSKDVMFLKIFQKCVKNAFWGALWGSLGAPVASWVPSGAPGGGFEPLEGGIEAYSLLIRIFSTPGIEPVRRWESNPFVAIPAFCHL